jgi:hypothetical protein
MMVEGAITERKYMSLSPKGFNELATRIRNHLGCREELASQYAGDIGDRPETVKGQIVIRNRDRGIIARIPASMWDKP